MNKDGTKDEKDEEQKQKQKASKESKESFQEVVIIAPGCHPNQLQLLCPSHKPALSSYDIRKHSHKTYAFLHEQDLLDALSLRYAVMSCVWIQPFA